MSEIPEEEGVTDGEYPNIICVLLESFIDPELVNFLQLSDEVVPNFHYLYNNYLFRLSGGAGCRSRHGEHRV